MSNFKYDLYVSLGEACSCSLALRGSKLQFYSYPLDWIFGAEIIERAKYFGNYFEHFIDKKDLTPSFEVRSASCRAYYNNLNGITFNHDFKNDIPFDEMHEKVIEKYKRRANRVIEQIKNSKNVLFVYIQSPDNDKILSDDTLKETQNLLQSYFPNVKIDLLYLSCKRDVKKMVKENISKNIRKFSFDYDMRNEQVPYAVNTKTLDSIFRHFSITDKHLTKDNIKDRNIYKKKMLLRGKLLINPLK